ncbi:unnamed protein product [Taenia asiatica]|uniref:tRNA-binding domain-containing protein n=1 Tax=Taenia asiatica TaxID=60517 RepID=A0A0R3VZ39_TAEAS|nr:unnamed protein product [Taenia asiatica]
MGIFVCNLKPVKTRGIESHVVLIRAADANGRVVPLGIESLTDLTLGAMAHNEYTEDLKS